MKAINRSQFFSVVLVLFCLGGTNLSYAKVACHTYYKPGGCGGEGVAKSACTGYVRDSSGHPVNCHYSNGSKVPKIKFGCYPSKTHCTGKHKK